MLHCPRNIVKSADSFDRFITGNLRDLGAGRRSDRRLAGRRWRRQYPGRTMQRQHVGRGGLGERARRPRQQQSRCLKEEQADARHADPARHEEEAGRRFLGRPSLQRQGRPDLQRPRSRRSTPTISRSRAACSASSAAARPGRASAPPIPSSPANSMAKGAPKTGRQRRRPPAGDGTSRARRRPRARAAAAKGKPQTADTVGDICLLPDIARFAH